MDPTDPGEKEEDEEREATSRRSDGLAATVIRGSTLSGFGYILAQALNLGVYVVLSRLLTPVEFGQYAAAAVLVGFGLLLTESGMQSAIVHRDDRIEEAANTALLALIVGGIASGIVAAAAAPALGAIFDDAKVQDLALASAGMILVGAMAIVPFALLQRRLAFLRIAIAEPVGVVVFGIVTIVLASDGFGPWALVIGQYADLFASAAVSWLLVRWRPRPRLATYDMWRRLAAYGRPVLTSVMISRLATQGGDALVIGKGLGAGALGQFRYAFRVASLPHTVLLAGAGFVIFPVLARIADQRERVSDAFLKAMRWLATLGLPAGMALIPLGPALIVLVFGEPWAPAGNAVAAMAAYVGGRAIVTAVIEMVKAVGNTPPLTRINLVIAVVTLGSMAALVPAGLTAAAAGISIGSIVGAAYAMWEARRAIGVPIRSMLDDIWPALVASTVMALAVLPLDRLVIEPATHGTAAGLALLVLEGIACLGVYVGVMAILAPNTLREIASTIARRGRADPAPAV